MFYASIMCAHIYAKIQCMNALKMKKKTQSEGAESNNIYDEA